MDRGDTETEHAAQLRFWVTIDSLDITWTRDDSTGLCGCEAVSQQREPF